MDYSQAIELLYNSLPVFQHMGPGAYKPGLDTSRRLDDMAGNPHRAYPTIHVAGTNGKGSTAHTLAAIRQSAGYRTGLYTSPHIYDFRERIRVDGEMIEEHAVVDFVERWIEARDSNPDLSPSFFELTSTMAFEYFARKKVDVAVIETGLGGRLDSTNVITPILGIITNISLDHTSLLGDTRTQIAREKAGIIKPGVPVVIGEYDDETEPVFRDTAAAVGAEILFAGPIEGRVESDCNMYPSTPFGPLRGELRGECQRRNAATVLKAVEVLRRSFDISDDAVASGIGNVTGLTHLFGRWSCVAEAPLTVCDTGHNQGGWELIINELKNIEQRPRHLVMGFVADKDLGHIFDLIDEVKDDMTLWFSGPSSQRGLPASELAAKAADRGLTGYVEQDVNVAVSRAREMAGDEGFVLIAGSNFLIADLQKIK